MIEFIKKNWLIAVISGATGSTVTVILIKHWFSKDMSDIVTNWITALSSLAVAVFAWMAYKYATKQYLQNEIQKVQFESKYQFSLNFQSLFIEVIDKLSHIYVEYCSFLDELTYHNTEINNEMFNTIESILRLEKELTQSTEKIIFKLPRITMEINFMLILNISKQDIQKISLLKNNFFEQLEETLKKLEIYNHTNKKSSTDFSGALEQRKIVNLQKLETYFKKRSTHYKNLINELRKVLNEFIDISKEFFFSYEKN